ncbi:hypothetical protein BKA24_001944 [Microbacterium marinum]|uniref:DUF6993 domain-containing protein n=1 Tax=Microbacterium marinum TaxID=421115 RepID=A0A7W7FJA3_9MICO|nr:hypothetical protein [Microbacterium marinum]
MRRHQHETPSRLLVVASAVLLAASVTACTPGGAGPSASSSPTATVTAAPTAPSPTATPTPAPEIPGGDASANLERFTDVVEGVWDAGRSVAGRDYIDALVDAGFAKDAMEVTFDRTSVDDPADSIQFSVHIGTECLVGQVGPSVRGPITRVLPELPAENCLVGETRTIDW